jgi:hypothetical protein
MNQNRFGLSRHIPSETSREVRQRSKFGCVVCRCAVYQYEHIDPEFKDAERHSADDICLLCGQCHDRVTRGRISKQTVRERYIHVSGSADVKRPFEELDIRETGLTVRIGSMTFFSPEVLFQINGTNVLAILPSTDEPNLPALSGQFFDETGAEIARIDNNVWESSVAVWDIETVGNAMTLRSSPDTTALRFEVHPPNGIVITELNMFKDGCHLHCRDGLFQIGQLTADSGVYFALENTTAHAARVAVSVDSRSISAPRLEAIQLRGGEGAFLIGSGIVLGVGSSSMRVGGIKARYAR